MLELALQLYNEMQQQGIRPDVITLSALITACKQLNHWEEAMDLVQEFSSVHGVKLNTIACNCLITTLGRAGRWQYAQQVRGFTCNALLSSGFWHIRILIAEL